MLQSRKLDDLDSRMKVKAFELLARAAEQRIPLLIVGTLRDLERQQLNVTQGVSWTMDSKHLAQPPENKALAIDVVPYELYQLHGEDKLNWNESDPVWTKIGAIGQALNLKWGVVINGKRKDLGHFEYI